MNARDRQTGRSRLSALWFRERRPLSVGEIELAREVFASSLDYAAIRLQGGGLLSLNAGAVVINNTIYFNASTYSSDFAAPDVRLSLRALLMHELVHVWQFQNLPRYHWLKAGFEHISHWGRVYDYDLAANPAKALLDYRYEQQGRLVQDYYMLKKLGHDVTAYEGVIGERLSVGRA
ncbi:MAG: basic secretory family protein [bacterium]|nr:basic secretory family protein [bacterium]